MAVYIGPETAFGKRTSGYTITMPTSVYNARYGKTSSWGKTPSSGWGGTTPTDKPDISSALQKAMAYYQQGGGFGKGVEAALERGRTKALASGAQSLVSAGLAGTSMMAGLGKKFEEEVAVPTRASVEEKRAEALANLEIGGVQLKQGAYESQANRDLQMYLAQLQSMNNAPVTSPATQQPIINITGNTGESGYKFPTAPSLLSESNYGGMSPMAALNDLRKKGYTV
jgi:hypothetical protein